MGFLDDGLVLGLGFSSETTPPVSNNQIIKPKIIGFELPSLSLGLISGNIDDQKSSDDQKFPGLYRQQGSSSNSPHEQSSGTVSSLISSGGNRVIIKRERDLASCGDEIDAADERLISGRVISDEDEYGSNARKKLRLNKQQSALLEESFKLHSTLNPKQKQALARQLNLRPRQVEVWFQNRRARTKLKQTEVDCEFLKKCCETLTDENRRLQKEVQELKALKLAQPFYMQMPAATLTMCPSCERIGTGTVGVGVGAADLGAGATKNPFSLAPKPHHFYNPFPNPSAAC